jgi:sarcosine oxidase subunit beta
MAILDRAEVVIIGGGAIGAATAFYLVQMGLTDVALVEKDYLAANSTGRCAGGIRAQWSTPANVKLAKYSIEAFSRFEQEVGFNTDWYQGGYLLLAYTPEQVEQFKRNIELQRSCGLDVRLLEPRQVPNIIPDFNTERLLAAAHCPTDGHANPFLTVQGYCKHAENKGARVHLRTAVTGIELENGRCTMVRTDRGDIPCRWVVNAAGAWSPQIGQMVGADLPVKPYRHQIMVTEPVEHFMDPLVVDFFHNLYFRQTVEGTVVMGQSDPGEPSSFETRNTWKFIHEAARKVTHLVPKLRSANLVRAWAGLYEVTPDAQPIIGHVNSVENFITATGYSGHGYMLAPASGTIVAEMIVHGASRTLPVEECSIERFRSGNIVKEANVV